MTKTRTGMANAGIFKLKDARIGHARACLGHGNAANAVARQGVVPVRQRESPLKIGRSVKVGYTSGLDTQMGV